MADPVAAFQGWNSSIQGWDTGTWNTNVAFPVTATASVNSATVATLGSFFTTNTVVQMTSAIGTATTSGDANVAVTGVSATGAIGVLGTIWGNIIPSQNSNFSNTTVSQTPSWVEIEHGRAA